MTGTVALQSQVPFPTFIKGDGLITVGLVSAATGLSGLNLETETLQIIAASPIAVTATAALLLNRAILQWKALGVVGAALQPRVQELIALISPNGWVLWSEYGVNPFSADNSAALNSLPSGVLILADTAGDHVITQQWLLKSNLSLLSDQSIRIVFNIPGFVNSITGLPQQNINFGVLGMAMLTTPGPFPFLDSIYLWGLNFHGPNVNVQMFSNLAFNANNVQVLWMTGDQYTSYICCVGSNIEIAYCTGTTSGSINPGPNGGPGIRVFGTTTGSAPLVPTTRAHSLWVHDCNLVSYDGTFQLSPNNHNWGAGLNFVDVMVENSIFNSLAGPFLLIGTNVTTRIITPFNYNINNSTFRNLSGSAAANPLYLLHGNNPNNSWTNMTFQNLTIDASPMTNVSPAIRLFCFGNAITPTAPAVTNLLFDNVVVTGLGAANAVSPARANAAVSIEGDLSAMSVSNVTFNNCSFNAPPVVSTRFAFNAQGTISNLKITNCFIGTARNGMDLGKAYSAFGVLGYIQTITNPDGSTTSTSYIPAVGDTLTLGTTTPSLSTTTYTFVTSTPVGNQIQIGLVNGVPDLFTTLNNIANVITSPSADANTALFTALVNQHNGNLTLTASAGGTVGNPLTFATTTNNVNVTSGTGTIAYTSNPLITDTLTLNGVICTFVSSAPTGTQILLGANLAATLNNIAAFINASTNAAIHLIGATATTSVLTLTSTITGFTNSNVGFATTTAGTTLTATSLSAGANTLMSNVLPNLTVTNTTISSITSLGGQVGVGILFENANALSVQNNTILLGGSLTNQIGLKLTLPGGGLNGTTNCVVRNNTINGMAHPPNSPTPDGNGNLFNGNN